MAWKSSHVQFFEGSATPACSNSALFTQTPIVSKSFGTPYWVPSYVYSLLSAEE